MLIFALQLLVLFLFDYSQPLHNHAAKHTWPHRCILVTTITAKNFCPRIISGKFCSPSSNTLHLRLVRQHHPEGCLVTRTAALLGRWNLQATSFLDSKRLFPPIFHAAVVAVQAQP